MATMRVKISDGTTTLDLYSGSDSYVRNGGIDMPPPSVRSRYGSNPVYDGARLASSKYDNRVISITTKIVGTTLADLKTNMRSIQRILNDARERVLLGFGTTYYLEIQWGDTAGQSTFFDILRGDLILPSNYMSQTLSHKFNIIDAVIELECKPFGRYTNQDISQETLENSQSAHQSKDLWAQDDDGHMDVDATLWKAQTFTAGSSYTATKAAIYGGRQAAPGDLTLSLYATTGGAGAEVPTGSAIATGTLDGDTIIESTAGYYGWLSVKFGTPVALTSGVVYAVVASAQDAVAGNDIQWRVDSTAGYGAGGHRCDSADGGLNWTPDTSDDFLFIVFGSETGNANYQDVTTTSSHGDVPARIYHKLDLSGATGSKKIWVAKRSGSRQTDSLWLEGEEATSVTQISADDDQGFANGYNTAYSGDLSGMYWKDNGAGGVLADVSLWRFNYSITTPPVGQFRVLLRGKITTEDANDFDHIALGAGWCYGDKTKTPAYASGEYFTFAANNTFEILDLGLLNLPPIASSDIASNNSFELRIFLFTLDTIAQNEYYKIEIDYIFLLPIDEGAVIIASIAADDVIALDGITDPQNVFIIDGSDNIEDYPDYVGRVFSLGRESTRIYVLRDDVAAVTFASDLKYQPQFMVV